MKEGPCALWGLGYLIDSSRLVGFDKIMFELRTGLVGLRFEQRDNIRAHSVAMQEFLICRRLIVTHPGEHAYYLPKALTVPGTMLANEVEQELAFEEVSLDKKDRCCSIA